MNILLELEKSFTQYIQSTFNLDTVNMAGIFALNTDEKKQEFGDINSNIAMIIAKQTKKSPRDIAQKISSEFRHESIDNIEIAGPGFINIYLTNQAFIVMAQQLTEQKKLFFIPENLKPKKINIEFVSANPTGPLHFGHGRGGIIGDVLGNILSFLGHDVTKEFYINDAGAQIKKLGNSFKIRCMQVAGHNIELPEDAYHGEYLLDLAQGCFAEHGHKIFEKDDNFFNSYAETELLNQIKQTLSDYGIHFDVWFSEKTLHDSKAVENAIGILEKNGLLYNSEDAIWFKTTEFGDDKDRVIRKASGEVTYIAADVAYLKNKSDRKFNNLIMILGHDHHSYVTRLECCKKGLELTDISLDVILYQLVKITKEGELVRMSKRAGNIITLQDIINTVGKDVARFFYLHRKADAQLEFDLELALKRSDENPVFYAQYAYVRTGSILQKAESLHIQNICVDDANHLAKEEQIILKKISSLSSILTDIANNKHTHLLTYFLLELATLFHHYYAHHQVIDMENIKKTRARLFIIMQLRMTFEIIFDLLGISKLEKM